MNTSRKITKARRHARVRAKISGTSARPRLNVYRSLKGLFVQLIDDQAGKTLVSVSSKEISSKAKKSEIASQVGKKAAEKAIAAGIQNVVFDRGGYKYHGRIKAVADGAREGGLKF